MRWTSEMSMLMRPVRNAYFRRRLLLGSFLRLPRGFDTRRFWL